MKKRKYYWIYYRENLLIKISLFVYSFLFVYLRRGISQKIQILDKVKDENRIRNHNHNNNKYEIILRIDI